MANKSYFFEVRKKNNTFNIVSVMQYNKLIRFPSENRKIKIVPKSYDTFVFPQDKYMLSVPYIFDVTAPSELYHVIYICKDEETLNNLQKKIEKSPEDILGKYYTKYSKLSEIPKEILERELKI